MFNPITSRLSCVSVYVNDSFTYLACTSNIFSKLLPASWYSYADITSQLGYAKLMYFSMFGNPTQKAPSPLHIVMQEIDRSVLQS